ncbi:LysR substrate-binding domain-containing protein [Streptomyces sp. NPDC090083]|uniref:LysR substrate-binding domain-containing protein n=1 Tax=Streptomyces sp. NPDC090083 TaxID=3365941 RepID=UPI0037FB188F
MLLVLPPGHEQAGREPVTLRSLRDEKWITGAGASDPATRLLAWACAREGFEPVHSIGTSDRRALLEFVAAGLGVALIPALDLVGQRDDDVVRTIAGPTVARRIDAVQLRTRVTESAGRLLSELRIEANRIRLRKGDPRLN